MEAFEAIHTRRSIREYQDKPVPEELVTEILKAAMASPSARNQQPWEFVVITDSELREKIPPISPFTQMIVDAPLAILVCGNLKIETAQGYWVVDCSAATQNLLLAAHALGLGAVWTGVYPREERMDGLTELLNLPEYILPHSLVVIGYPAQQPPQQDRFKPDRIHFNGW
ncbi:nitroreductase family protein [Chloroflexota bacterium]